LVDNDGLSEESLFLTEGNQMPVSNQNMVEMGKKLLQAASENDVDNVRLLMSGGAPFTGNWVCFSIQFPCYSFFLNVSFVISVRYNSSARSCQSWSQ